MFYTPTPSSEPLPSHIRQAEPVVVLLVVLANVRVSVTKIEFKSYVERIKIFMENIVHLSTTTNGNVGLVWDVLQSAKKFIFLASQKFCKEKHIFAHTYIHIIVIVAFSHTEPTTIICARTKV